MTITDRAAATRAQSVGAFRNDCLPNVTDPSIPFLRSHA